MSTVRTFRAASMPEALQMIRQELGGEAIILQTREVPRKRRLPWSRNRTDVEVMVGMNAETRQTVKSGIGSDTSPSMVAQPRTATASPRAKAAERTSFSPSTANGPGSRSLGKHGVPSAGTNRLPSTRTARTPAAGPSTEELLERLDKMQKAIEELGRAGKMQQREEIPAGLFHLFTNLIDADVEESLARELIFRLKSSASPDQLKDAAASQALIQDMVRSDFHCEGPIRLTPGRRKVVALVGPTGVGKTTTIAKLAANFRIRDDIRMGLVTVDTYRIAAVEQLRTYAEIIDLPMKVVTSPQEMKRALDELAGLDLILVDTAGRSPRDDLRIQELKTLLAEAEVDEVHLVMSMTAGLKSLLSTAEKFSAAKTTSLILTKLDEAAGLGTMLSVVRETGLPISYLTTGQAVPEDIEPAEPERLARLVLSRDEETC